jgi:hypothetical protein
VWRPASDDVVLGILQHPAAIQTSRLQMDLK